MNKPEISAPAGNWESLMAAIQAGADSVYFGIGELNMRARSSLNFTLRDLVKIERICRKHRVRSYLALNAILYDSDLKQMKRIVDCACRSGIDSIIATDPAVIRYASSAGVQVHISTQANITNLETVKYWSRFAGVMILARELNLGQIAAISRAVKRLKIVGPDGLPVRLEAFVHGAMCMAVAGQCSLSLDNFNSSANRGACYQLCRRSYRITDTEGEVELLVEDGFVLSPKDLCTISFLDKLLKAGISVLKIEGRGRSPEYVSTVVSCYREAVEAIGRGTYTTERITGWTERLKTVYNRGFWEGWYLGRKTGEWTRDSGSVATQSKEYVGKVLNYYTRQKVALIRIDSGALAPGDKIYIQGPTTGVVEHTIHGIQVEGVPFSGTQKGEVCTIPVYVFVRRADKIYRILPGYNSVNPDVAHSLP